MKNLITKIMIALTAVAMLIGMSSCYTERTAQRQVDKAHHKFPEVPAKLCAERYPTTDSVSIVKEYIPGELMVFTDTLVETWLVSDTTTRVKYITKTIKTTDTLRDTRYVQLENKAALALKDASIKKLNDQIILLTDGRNNWRKYALIFGSVLAAYVLYRLVRLYLKRK